MHRRGCFASVEFKSIYLQQEPIWPRGPRVVQANLGDESSTGTSFTRTVGKRPIQTRLAQS